MFLRSTCEWLPVQVQYGFLEEGRKLEIRSISNAVSDNRRMCKIYAILNLVGFKNATGLDAHDRATLTFVEKYVKFKQGEIWIDMNTYFKATGFRPTASDRERLQSGIEFSQHLANVLIKDQQTVLLGATPLLPLLRRQDVAPARNPDEFVPLHSFVVASNQQQLSALGYTMQAR